MQKPHAISAILAILLTIGSSQARAETDQWSDGPKAANNGCVVAVQGFWEHSDHIHVRLEIRNLTQRDVTFNAGESWITAHADGQVAIGRVTAERIDPTPDAVNLIEVVPITGDFTVRGHASEIIDADFPSAKRFTNVKIPVTIDLAGHWTFGDAMGVELSFHDGKVTALALVPTPTPGHG